MTLSEDRKDPMERTDPADATPPIESTEPIDPIDRTELCEPMDRTESRDQSDHREPSPRPFTEPSSTPEILRAALELRSTCSFSVAKGSVPAKE
jgi:hypothetical protein